ncbi:MAG: DUF892 family protein [Verrucomicrobiota bacterium]
MKLNSMQDLLVAELQDLLSAERQVATTLPKVTKAANNPTLRRELEAHLKASIAQEQRLEKCFRELGVKPETTRSHGMIGLISGWMEIQSTEAQQDVMDAAIISSVQHMEHYEIAGYGCARSFAEVLKKDTVVSLLTETLQEEEAFDRRLTEVAKTLVNTTAELHTR